MKPTKLPEVHTVQPVDRVEMLRDDERLRFYEILGLERDVPTKPEPPIAAMFYAADRVKVAQQAAAEIEQLLRWPIEDPNAPGWEWADGLHAMVALAHIGHVEQSLTMLMSSIIGSAARVNVEATVAKTATLGKPAREETERRSITLSVLGVTPQETAPNMTPADEAMLNERVAGLYNDVARLNEVAAALIEQADELCAFSEDYYREDVATLASALRDAAGKFLVDAMFVRGIRIGTHKVEPKEVDNGE